MSIKFIDWAFRLDGLNPTKKVILIALADNADDDGKCWPSMSRLCKKTGISTKSTVRKNIKELAELGYISIENRTRINGSLTSNMYTLGGGSKNDLGVEINPRVGSEMGVGVGSDLGVLYEPPSKPPIEPSPNNDQKDLEIKFNRFWERYPRKIGKKKAKQFFAKINYADSEFWRDFMFGLTEYVNHHEMIKTETKYIKHPASWINGEHWEDELPSANYGEKPTGDPAIDRLKNRLNPQRNEMKVIN